MKDVAGRPLVLRCLERAVAMEGVDEVILATTNFPEDRELLSVAGEWGVQGFAGNADDVLDRYYQAAVWQEAEVVMRLTGDCPLLDPKTSSSVLRRFDQGGLDYASNTLQPTFPDGLDTEVFTFQALRTAWYEAELRSDREHVTQFIVRQPERFRVTNVANQTDLSNHRWTVDELEDLEFVREVYRGLQNRGLTGHDFHEVLKVIEEDGLQDASNRYRRNEGLLQSLREDSSAGSTT